MSILDKVVAAVTPPESEQARVEARAKAHDVAEKGSWLALALEHHDLLRAAFRETRSAGDASARTTALRNLSVLLLGHAQAEESILYPALAACDEEARAEMGYNEQAMVKMQMALLEKLPPMSQEFADKLEHIEGAVLHHMYEEEGTWFLELQQKAESQATLTRRFREEFERYAG
jgi:hemerythrin superfamily protein